MVDNDYFYLKNTHSYDKAVASLKYLREEFYGYCRETVYRFLSENYYTKADYFAIHKEDYNAQILVSEVIQNFGKYRGQIFPNIEAAIYFRNNYFYLLFTNLDAYNLREAIEDTRVIYMQHIPTPDKQELVNEFYLSTMFFEATKLDFSDFNVQEHRPDLETRAKNQIKIILQEQVLAKNNNISYSEVLKINSTVATHDNSNLIQKIKLALSKAEPGFSKQMY